MGSAFSEVSASETRRTFTRVPLRSAVAGALRHPNDWCRVEPFELSTGLADLELYALPCGGEDPDRGPSPGRRIACVWVVDRGTTLLLRMEKDNTCLPLHDTAKGVPFLSTMHSRRCIGAQKGRFGVDGEGSAI